MNIASAPAPPVATARASDTANCPIPSPTALMIWAVSFDVPVMFSLAIWMTPPMLPKKLDASPSPASKPNTSSVQNSSPPPRRLRNPLSAWTPLRTPVAGESAIVRATPAPPVFCTSIAFSSSLRLIQAPHSPRFSASSCLTRSPTAFLRSMTARAPCASSGRVSRLRVRIIPSLSANENPRSLWPICSNE